MKRQNGEKKTPKINKVLRQFGLLEWKQKFEEFTRQANAARVRIKQYTHTMQALMNNINGYIQTLKRSSDYEVFIYPRENDNTIENNTGALATVVPPLVFHGTFTSFDSADTNSKAIAQQITINLLKTNIQELAKNLRLFAEQVNKISILDADIAKVHSATFGVLVDANYAQYQAFVDGRMDRYKQNMATMLTSLEDGKKTLEKYSSAVYETAFKYEVAFHEEDNHPIKQHRKKKLLREEKHASENLSRRLAAFEYQSNIDRIKQHITHFFQACKEKNALAPSSVEINLVNLLAESRAKKREKLLKFNKLQIPTLLIPAVENVEQQRIEFYEALSTILSSDISTLEKYKHAIALKNNVLFKMIDTLSSYGNDVLEPDGELCLEEIYFGTIHKYEQTILNIAQCVHCENMRHKQVLSDKLDILQEQPNYSTLNEKQYLGLFNAYSRSFKLSPDLALVEDDSLKLQKIGSCIKTARVLLMPSNTDSDDSDVESKERKEAANVNFDELTFIVDPVVKTIMHPI